MREFRRKKGLFLLLVIVMLAAVVLTGCKSTAEPEEDPWAEMESQIPEDEFAGIPVDNAYMTFNYPQEWEGKVETEQTEENGEVRVSFRTEISGENVELFSVVMGPNVTDGYLLGHLDDPSAGKICVCTAMNEVDPEDWSEEDYNEICSLQERVNDIIVQFHEDERFIPVE